MARFSSLRLATPLLALAFSMTPTALTQELQPAPTWSQEDALRIVKEVQKKLGSLTNFSVFDWITFGVHGKTLACAAMPRVPHSKTMPAAPSRASRASRTSKYEIEVLPLSPNDDRIRAAVYNRIYTQPL